MWVAEDLNTLALAKKCLVLVSSQLNSTASVKKAKCQRLFLMKCGQLLKVAVTRGSLT